MSDKILLEIPNILTKQECLTIIQQANNISHKLTNAVHSDELSTEEYGWSNINGYNRALIVNSELTTKMFEKVKRLIPAEYNGNVITHINPSIRLLNYENYGKLPIHYDAANIDLSNNKIHKTVFILSIYLNDNFNGGETDFIDFDTLEVEKSIKPQTGKAIIFSLNNAHRGNKVIELDNNDGYELPSRKYLLKCDIMGYEL